MMIIVGVIILCIMVSVPSTRVVFIRDVVQRSSPMYIASTTYNVPVCVVADEPRYIVRE